jgi:signal peptidase I
MKKIINHLISIIFAIIIVLLLQAFVITGTVMHNSNMTPILKSGDRLIVNKITTTFNLLKNNDIIMYHYNGHTYVGRIIGEPGQSIVIKNGKLRRDDRQVNEPYVKSNSIDNLALRQIKGSESDIVPTNNYFVLNDQRQNKDDSRNFGYINKKDIIGEVSLRYYPFKTFTVDFK